MPDSSLLDMIDKARERGRGREGKHHEAIAALDRAEDQTDDPHWLDAMLLRAGLLIQQQRFGEAESLLSEVCRHAHGTSPRKEATAVHLTALLLRECNSIFIQMINHPDKWLLSQPK